MKKLGVLCALVLSGCVAQTDPDPDPISLPHRGSPESDAGHGCINCPQDVPHVQVEGSKSLDATKSTLGPKG